ncbi:hypothetical protein CDD83_5049 [Cordyceps sp. RAO-2017]|nr:hypothetical protein CDD83_5049 [Cordyceps sp. RAO-2017]
MPAPSSTCSRASSLLAMSHGAVAGLWPSRHAQLIRNRLFYEFALFVLGGGNTLILLLFWPGWLLVGLACWAVWQMAAR